MTDDATKPPDIMGIAAEVFRDAKPSTPEERAAIKKAMLASSEEAHGDCGSRKCACYRRGVRDALMKISSFAERMRL